MFIKLSKMQGSSVRARNAKYVIILDPLDKCLLMFMEITPLSQCDIAGNSVSYLSKLRVSPRVLQWLMHFKIAVFIVKCSAYMLFKNSVNIFIIES